MQYNNLVSFNHINVLDSDDIIFYNMTFSVEKNRKMFITGHNDYQRTQIFRTILGLNEINHGTRTLFGVNIDKIGLFRLIELRKLIGYVHPQGGLLQNITIIDNIKLPLYYSGNEKHEDIETKTAELIDFMDLKDTINNDIRKLTNFEIKMICLARAIIAKPRLLLIDEPTLYIELSDIEKIIDIIKKIINLYFNNDITVIISSDNTKWINESGFDKIKLSNGIIQKEIKNGELV